MTSTEPIRSSRYFGEDVVTRFLARDDSGDEGAALIDTDVESIDIVVMRRGSAEPYWQMIGVDTDDLYQGSPQAWDLDSTGFLWKHRLEWGAADDYGQAFEPAPGSTVHIFYRMNRADMGPITVEHAAHFRYGPN